MLKLIPHTLEPRRFTIKGARVALRLPEAIRPLRLPHVGTLPLAERYLTGHGVKHLMDALNGMKPRKISLDDVKMVCLTEADYETFVTHEGWRRFSDDPKELREYGDTVAYMVEEELLRPYGEDLPYSALQAACDRQAWNDALHGRLQTA